MDLKLTAIRGPYAGRTAIIKESELTIGRDRSNNIPLGDDASVSRIHAKLFRSNGRWFLVDLGSSSGTFLDGIRVGAEPISILDSAELAIGASHFRLDLAAPELPQPLVAAPSEPLVPSLPPISSVRRPTGRALREALAVYDRGLKQALWDLVVTKEEVEELQRVQMRLGLTDGDTFELRAQAYAFLADRITKLGRDDLMDANAHLLESFGLVGSGHPAVVSALTRHVAQLHLKELSKGNLPQVIHSRLRLLSSEVSHIEIEAKLLEERVVRSGWMSGHVGATFRIAKGVYFNLGGTEGRYISERDIVPVSKGILAITNQRIAFLGNPKTFEAKWGKIMGIDPMADGLAVYVANRTKSGLFQYESPEQAEVVAAVCSALLS